jgi:ribosomal protein S1/(E)-4-hydroxy-3-methyl-but-2-enyl pyrophosphate reductase
MKKEFLVAPNSGFCFGVRRAIEKTEAEVAAASGKIYTWGPLIHNKLVTDELASKGVSIIETLDDVQSGDVIIVRSHGETKKFFEQAEARDCKVVDATCPFVKKIQQLAEDAYASGKQVVIVGDKNHPEVKGINGWCDNSAIVLNSAAEAEAYLDGRDLSCADAQKFFLVAQTTIKKELFDDVVAAFERANADLEVNNTICNATAIRQKSCAELAEKCDAMLIIGGRESSNTQKLFEISSEKCKKTFFVEKITDLPLQALQDCVKIGFATGASTPERVIKEVIATMIEKNEMSMEELLATEEYDLDGAMRLPRLNEVVNGTVHQVTEKGVIVDMGCKKDGIIPKEEVTLEGDQTLADLFKVGDEIQAKVVKTDDGEGVITLSKKKLEVNEHWNEINAAYENKEIITVKVVRQVNGGVIAAYKEVSGFIPLSQLSDKYVENADEFIGQELTVKVTRVDLRRGRAVFSHKTILADEKKKKIEEIWSTLNVGDVVEGTVMRFTDYGAFVDLGGLDGLLHISEISWGKLKHPQEVLQIGDKVKVKILSMNEEKNKISLGLKQTTPEPWSVINEKYEVGQIVTGKVVQIKEYGAFVELEPGLDGLVHISEVAHKRVNDIAEELQLGQEVEAKILDIDTERKRISLSIKQTTEAPVAEEAEAEEEVPAEEE